MLDGGDWYGCGSRGGAFYLHIVGGGWSGLLLRGGGGALWLFSFVG